MAAARKTTASRRSRAERDAQAADAKAQETGPPVTNRRRVSWDYITTKHPDTKLEVTFVPGEALPDWVEIPDEDLR